MFKRSIALFLAVGMCLSLSTSVMAANGQEEIEVRITAFEDYTAEGSNLTADRMTTFNEIALFKETNDGLKLNGVIPNENQYDISVVMGNGEFTNAAEKNGNYTVLSVIAFEDIVRVILGDNNKHNMYYIEFGSDTLTSVKPYKVTWYHSFLAPEVEVSDKPIPNTVSDHDREFSTSTTIYGDKYDEILVLRFSNDWDNPVSAGVGYSAITKMRLLSKTTSITRSGSSKATTAQGNSLFVNRIKYTATSPYRWDYYVASTGNCNGVDVTMISEPQYFSNHLYYTLSR